MDHIQYMQGFFVFFFRQGGGRSPGWGEQADACHLEQAHPTEIWYAHCQVQPDQDWFGRKAQKMHRFGLRQGEPLPILKVCFIL